MTVLISRLLASPTRFLESEHCNRSSCVSLCGETSHPHVARFHLAISGNPDELRVRGGDSIAVFWILRYEQESGVRALLNCLSQGSGFLLVLFLSSQILASKVKPHSVSKADISVTTGKFAAQAHFQPEAHFWDWAQKRASGHKRAWAGSFA